jgi:hypothetical protein
MDLIDDPEAYKRVGEWVCDLNRVRPSESILLLARR